MSTKTEGDGRDKHERYQKNRKKPKKLKKYKYKEKSPYERFLEESSKDSSAPVIPRWEVDSEYEDEQFDSG